MTNHMHLIAVPHVPTALARGLGRAHYDYAREFKRGQQRSGHLWQNRFYSCPLSGKHLRLALRYVDLNPVRAGMVAEAGDSIAGRAPRRTSAAATRSNCWT